MSTQPLTPKEILEYQLKSFEAKQEEGRERQRQLEAARAEAFLDADRIINWFNNQLKDVLARQGWMGIDRKRISFSLQTPTWTNNYWSDVVVESYAALGYEIVLSKDERSWHVEMRLPE
jgi:hypothetical protein